jgi:hypothetical protein
MLVPAAVLPEITIAYNCPRIDTMKIWLLPVEQPWDGEIANFGEQDLNYR